MSTEILVEGLTLQDLVGQNRIPKIITGWSAGPFCLVPPQGCGPGEDEVVLEQVGLFQGGYGTIIPLDEQEALNLSHQISAALNPSAA